MDKLTTTTHRQYVDRPDEDELLERYKVSSLCEDGLYISMIYVESVETENRYEPHHRGWEYAREINETRLPEKHIEELADVKARLSGEEVITAESALQKAEI